MRGMMGNSDDVNGMTSNNSFKSGFWKGDQNMGMMNGFGSFGGFGFGTVVMAIFWGLVILGIVGLVKWIGMQGQQSQKEDKSALNILKERYAKGEIDKKEFEEKKKDLG